MKIVNRRQLRKKTKSEKNVTDRLTELEKMVRRLRYNAILDIKEIESLWDAVSTLYQGKIILWYKN